MSRRRQHKDSRKFDYTQLIQNVRNLMRNRTFVLAPLPCDPVDLWWHTWEGDAEAVKILHGRYPKAFHTGNVIRIKLGETAIADIRIPVNEQLPVRDMMLQYEIPHYRHYPELVSWHANFRALREQELAVIDRVERVSKLCATPGQLARVWPDILGFFAPYDRSKIAAKRTKSAMPDRAYADYGKTQLVPELNAEELEQYGQWMAEALLLPQIELTARSEAFA